MLLHVEDADAPLTALPLLTTPVDFSSGTAADQIYIDALSSLVAPPGGAVPLSSTEASDRLFYCVHSTPLQASAPPSELRVRLIDGSTGSSRPLVACSLAHALPGDGATRYYAESSLSRLRLAFEQGSSSGWELVGVAMRVGEKHELGPQLLRVHTATALLAEEPADGVADVVAAVDALEHGELRSPESVALASTLRRAVAAQLRRCGALLPSHEAEWIEMCLPEWEEHAALSTAERRGPLRPLLHRTEHPLSPASLHQGPYLS